MKTCKDCLHYEACKDYGVDDVCKELGVCKQFTDRSEWVHLPCKAGDTVYCIDFAEDIGIDNGIVYAFSHTDNQDWFSARYESGLRYDHPSRVLGKTVFLTREEAEKALKEREENDCL